ncbi:RimK family alpha-L-glutamate ligase [Candidatus Woesearchaeota archaeon]|nr:RimK family alpha-L-glutamate ligase [Candidatus Woesearchaeota archaeon]
MRLAIISLGGTSSELIAKEAKDFFEKVDLLDIRKIEIHAHLKKLEVIYEKKPIQEYDCIYIRGSFNYSLLQRSLAYILKNENTYIPFQPDTFTVAHDKFLTILSLQKNGVKVPTTYLAATMKAAKKLLEDIHFPIIMKVPSGTQGKGVMSADSLASARSMLDTLESLKQPVILQEYIETGATDVRVIVAGKKVIACMKRKGRAGEIRSNIHQGGVGIPYELDYQGENDAIRAARAVGADICGVDMLESAKGNMIIEVNLSPGLKGIMNATKKNVAKLVAEFLYKQTAEFKKGEKEKGVEEIMKIIKTKNEKENEKAVLTNLDIKAGKIRLPELMTKISGFREGEEVVLVAENGKVEVRRHDVK